MAIHFNKAFLYFSTVTYKFMSVSDSFGFIKILSDCFSSKIYFGQVYANNRIYMSISSIMSVSMPVSIDSKKLVTFKLQMYFWIVNLIRIRIN